MRSLAAAPGLVAMGYLIPVSGWWFTQLPGLLEKHSPSVAGISLQALQATLILQLIVVTLFSPLWSASRNEQPAWRNAIVTPGLSVALSILPAWPLLAMLCLASVAPFSKLAQVQVAVLAAGLAVALLARGFRNFEFGVEATRLLQAFLGLVAATLAWIFRHAWWQWAVS